MRKKIYFGLTILNSLLFSFVLCCFLGNNLENIIGLGFGIIISSILFILILYSFWKTGRWTIIYNILIGILTPFLVQYQQTLSSIILIIFFSLPLILPYKEEETNIKYHKSYYIVNCCFIAIYKGLFLYAFLGFFGLILTILIMSGIIYYLFFSKLSKKKSNGMYLIHSFMFFYSFNFLLKLLITSLDGDVQLPFIHFYIIIFIYLSLLYIGTINNLITFHFEKKKL